jgi:hypothetical protein
MGTDPEFRKARALFKHLPRDRRCKMCGVPFAGPMAPFMRMRRRGRWAKNPKCCGARYGTVRLEYHPIAVQVRVGV